MTFTKAYLIIFFSFSLTILGQKENAIWYFGGDNFADQLLGTGIDFNSGLPVTLTNSQMKYTEGSAVQCNRNGGLLFYTNGVEVWDKTHSIMQNGSGLCGHLSAEQSCIIIPFPNDTMQYYIFSNDGYPTCTGAGLFYSIIDMNLNGGNGAVTNTKCVSLLTNTSEGLTATRHSNSIDYWLVATQHTTSTLYSYQISSAGISPPVVSSLNINYTDDIIKIDFNNKGDLFTLNTVKYYGNNQWTIPRYIANYNKTSGIANGVIAIDSMQVNHGACFSPNDNLFYYYGITNGNSTLFQCDLNSPNIPASKQIIKVISTSNYFSDMKLGPDGKIYCNKGQLDSIDRINNPNISGQGCNYQSNAVYLNGVKSGYFFPNRTFGKYLNAVGIRDNYLESKFTLAPNPSNGILTLKTQDISGTYTIYDSFGNKILTDNFDFNDSVQINILGSKGLYFLIIQDKNTIYCKKTIIKN